MNDGEIPEYVQIAILFMDQFRSPLFDQKSYAATTQTSIA
jgi:hypothetical protein